MTLQYSYLHYFNGVLWNASMFNYLLTFAPKIVARNWNFALLWIYSYNRNFINFSWRKNNRQIKI